jgi:hypothetical protein
MGHTVVIANKIMAKDNDSLVRPVISTGSALDNGTFFSLLDKTSASATEAEVWATTVPTTGSLTGLWMALEPEIPSVFAGSKQYRGLGTVQDFYNSASTVFTAVKLQPGDIFTLTVEGLDSGTVAAYAVAVSATYKLNWSAVGLVGTSLTCRYLRTRYISIPDGSIGTQRVTAYEFEVWQN